MWPLCHRLTPPPPPNPTSDCIWILNYGTRLDFLAGNGPNFVLELICALLPELLLTFLHKAAYKSHLPNAGSTDQSSMAEWIWIWIRIRIEIGITIPLTPHLIWQRLWRKCCKPTLWNLKLWMWMRLYDELLTISTNGHNLAYNQEEYKYKRVGLQMTFDRMDSSWSL